MIVLFSWSSVCLSVCLIKYSWDLPEASQSPSTAMSRHVILSWWWFSWCELVHGGRMIRHGWRQRGSDGKRRLDCLNSSWLTAEDASPRLSQLMWSSPELSDQLQICLLLQDLFPPQPSGMKSTHLRLKSVMGSKAPPTQEVAMTTKDWMAKDFPHKLFFKDYNLINASSLLSLLQRIFFFFFPSSGGWWSRSIVPGS